MAFQVDLRAFIDKAKGNSELVVRKVGLDMLARIIDRSPVGNPDLWQTPPAAGYVGGRFRGNWQVTFGTQAISETGRIDPSGNDTLRAGQAVMAAYQRGIDSIWLSNTVPYALPLEFGWSSQAPAGVARVTAAEFQQFVNQAAKELSR